MVDEPERLRLESARIGAVPLINAFLDRLGLPALLHSVLAVTDPRLKLAPATAVRLVVINLLIGREPIYGLSEWAARYSPDLLGLSQAELAVLNDDRLARGLGRVVRRGPGQEVSDVLCKRTCVISSC